MPIGMIFFVLPKMKPVFEAFDSKQPNLLTLYFSSLVQAIFGIINIFVGLKLLLKSTVSREKYFKVGVILAVAMFLLMSISQAFNTLSVVSPLYNLMSNIDQKTSFVTPRPLLTPTLDPTADWKTYKYKTFSVRLSDRWIATTLWEKVPSAYWIEGVTFRTKDEVYDITFQVTDNMKPLEEALGTDDKAENITLDGQPAVKFIVVTGQSRDDLYMPTVQSNYGGRTFIIYISTGSNEDVIAIDKEFNQILSTFKFLDQEQKGNTQVDEEIVWNVKSGLLPPSLENEIKEAVLALNPEQVNPSGDFWTVDYAYISTISANWAVLTLSEKNRNPSIQRTGLLEYLLHKTKAGWQVTRPSNSDFCQVFRQAPDDLTDKDYYLGCK